MKKDTSRRFSTKEEPIACSYCKGTGSDLSRSLWGEFVCPICGGTGKQDMRYEVLTWDPLYDIMLDLAKKVIDSRFLPDVIVAVSSGGLIPSRVLCDLLNNPFLTNVDVDLDKAKNHLTRLEQVSDTTSGRKVLIIDQVADTGSSLKLVKEQIIRHGAKEVRTLTLYVKPWSTIKPDYYGMETSHWLVFPWEIKRTVKSIAEQSESKTRRKLLDLKGAGLPPRLAKRFLKEIVEECQKS